MVSARRLGSRGAIQEEPGDGVSIFVNTMFPTRSLQIERKTGCLSEKGEKKRAGVGAAFSERKGKLSRCIRDIRREGA